MLECRLYGVRDTLPFLLHFTFVKAHLAFLQKQLAKRVVYRLFSVDYGVKREGRNVYEKHH